MRTSIDTQRVRFLRCLIAVIAATMMMVGAASAGQDYVSLKGGFYITCPDDWKQIDYTTVDAVLNMWGADRESYMYEAVFAEDIPGIFFEHQYLILTLDSADLSSQRRIDSVLNATAESFERPIVNRDLSTDLTGVTEDDVSLDRANGLVAVTSTLESEDGRDKRHLYAMKAYADGTAHFLFYCPDTAYAAALPVFNSILASFSTEDIRSHLVSEDVKLADPERLEDSDKGVSTGLLGGAGGAVVIVIVLIAATARKKRKKQPLQ